MLMNIRLKYCTGVFSIIDLYSSDSYVTNSETMPLFKGNNQTRLLQSVFRTITKSHAQNLTRTA